jgi:deazaflavin-dependent oxidoreductase (nitroreductase family)
MTMNAASKSSGIPSIVSTLSPLVRRLLRLGMPMGQNALLTVRGRTSGQPRTFPITLLESDGHRYVFAAFGDVKWVQNLRASGQATLRRGRREEAVAALELTPEEAGPIMQAALAPALKMKMFGSMIGGWYGVTQASTPADYMKSARSHTGFELRAAR